MGLPQSPAAAIIFILVVLAVAYAVLRTLIRTAPLGTFQAGETRDTNSGLALESVDETAVPDTQAESSAGEVTPVPAPPVEKAIVLEAARIRSRRIALGDPAGSVMQALRRNESADMPVIDRHPSGYAVRVQRRYRIEGRDLTLVFQREELPQRLQLVEIGIGAA
jgi:hypothetical protein